MNRRSFAHDVWSLFFHWRLPTRPPLVPLALIKNKKMSLSQTATALLVSIPNWNAKTASGLHFQTLNPTLGKESRKILTQPLRIDNSDRWRTGAPKYFPQDYHSFATCRAYYTSLQAAPYGSRKHKGRVHRHPPAIQSLPALSSLAPGKCNLPHSCSSSQSRASAQLPL